MKNLPTVVGELVAEMRECIGNEYMDETARRRLTAIVDRLSALTAEAGKGEVTDGWVQVEVSAMTGSGKSAICKEIVILCRALGLEVEWDDQGELKMVGGDAQHELEMYRPKVRVVERNIPRPKFATEGK